MNERLVPYNRDLCVKYDAHINVECVAVRSVIKYLYKYVHKEHDRATIVATYLQLSHVGGFLSSAYSINILPYRSFNTTCPGNN